MDEDTLVQMLEKINAQFEEKSKVSCLCARAREKRQASKRERARDDRTMRRGEQGILHPPA